MWVSISTDLHLDATRDFRDLGCHVNIINNLQTLDKETRAFGLSKDYQVLPLSPLLFLYILSQPLAWLPDLGFPNTFPHPPLP